MKQILSFAVLLFINLSSSWAQVQKADKMATQETKLSEVINSGKCIVRVVKPIIFTPNQNEAFFDTGCISVHLRERPSMKSILDTGRSFRIEGETFFTGEEEKSVGALFLHLCDWSSPNDFINPDMPILSIQSIEKFSNGHLKLECPQSAVAEAKQL